MEKKQLITSWKIIIPFHLLFVVLGVSGVLNPLKAKSLFLGLAINAGYQMILVIMIGIVLKGFLGDTWTAFRANGAKNNMKRILIGFSIIFVTCMICRFVTVLCCRSSGVTQNQAVVNEYISYYPVLTFVLSAFIGPFTEEVLYRGIIFQTIRPKGKVIACLGSGFFFGFIHMVTTIANGVSDWRLFLFQLLVYMAMGISFAIVMEKYKNLCVNYFVHLSWNALSSGLVILIQALR